MNPVKVRSGLLAVVEGVRGYFAANGVDAEVHVGLRARFFWSRQRVVFIPGDYRGEDSPKPMGEGTLTPPEHTKSDDPRELATWERIVTADILGVDTANKSSEEAQIAAAENLLESTVQALWNGYRPAGVNSAYTAQPGDTKEYGYLGRGAIEFGAVTRVYPPAELGYGAELLLQFTLKGPLFDVPSTIVFPTKAVLTQELNGEVVA